MPRRVKPLVRVFANLLRPPYTGAMSTRTGLRTEIVVSTVLLLGAALLFAGFLLVKLTEGELLAERRLSLQRTARLLSAGEPSPETLSSRLLMLNRDGELRAWRLLDVDLMPRLSFAQDGEVFPAEPPAVGPEPGDLAESISYSSSLPFFGPAPRSVLDLAVRVGGSGGVLQLRFSLDSLVEQVHRSQQLILIYVIAYGVILSIFGIYLLGRNVVEPVRRLRAATAGVANGDLTRKINVSAHLFSKAAEEKIKAAGGTVTVIEKKAAPAEKK